MEKKQKNPWIIIGVLVFSALVATFNETILNVALRIISEDMHTSMANVQWLITGYMLVTSVMVPVTAFLYQSIPTKKLFLGAMLIILVGTAGCLFAPVFPVLLACRMIQAVGTGMMIPIMMNTVLLVVPKSQIGTAMALCVCGITLGPAFGPTVSGILVQFFYWKSVFVLLLILLLIAIIAGAIVIENVAPLSKPHLDIFSVVLSTAGLAAFLYGVSVVMSNVLIGLICIIVGVIVLAIFVMRQNKLKEPLLNFKPFTNMQFTLGVAMVFIAMLINFSLNAVMPSFLQGAFGVASMASAVMLLPGVLLNALSTNISGKILDKHGVKVMLPVGFAVFSIALFTLSRCNEMTSLILIVVLHILIYQGLAFSMSPAQTSALATLTPEMNSHGVAIVNTFMQIAASVGSSLFGGIQSVRQASAMANGAAETSAIAYGFSGTIMAAFVMGVIGIVLAILYARKENTMRVDDMECNNPNGQF